MRQTLDIYIVGLGGQGILTIGDLLTQAAVAKGYQANFYPTKGMSQRGGFVQGQLRIGRAGVGASLPPGGGDLVVAMERSEAFKAVRYCGPDTEFMLYDGVLPTAKSLLGQEAYPTLAELTTAVKSSGATMYFLDAKKLPLYEGKPVYANMFILGALLQLKSLARLFSYDELVEVIQQAWPGHDQANLAALAAGKEAQAQML